MEYEYHTEVSLGKRPQIDILFAVKKREQENHKETRVDKK